MLILLRLCRRVLFNTCLFFMNIVAFSENANLPRCGLAGLGFVATQRNELWRT